MEKYECIFCGESVEVKVTALLVETNWEKEEDEQQYQQCFCHLGCLKKVMKNSDYLYIED